MLENDNEPWVGVDLDGTLAYYDETEKWDGSIGEPIQNMVEIVQDYIDNGMTVKIMTARVAQNWGEKTVLDQIERINSWCMSVFGQLLPITSEKDHNMVHLYDDRATHVLRNSGVFITPYTIKRLVQLASEKATIQLSLTGDGGVSYHRLYGYPRPENKTLEPIYFNRRDKDREQFRFYE